jgi:hypothetical protein
MSGKGDKRRPMEIDNKTYESNWDRIFGNKQKQSEKDWEEPELCSFGETDGKCKINVSV